MPEMTTQHMVVAEHVCRSYRGPAGPVTALDDVSFTLAAGRVILLLGANGAGKSTLVHIACQVLKSDSGRISLGITRGSELGWCSQTQVIDWWATVYGNVYLGPRLGGSNRKEAAAAARAALELVGLAELGQPALRQSFRRPAAAGAGGPRTRRQAFWTNRRSDSTPTLHWPCSMSSWSGHARERRW